MPWCQDVTPGATILPVMTTTIPTYPWRDLSVDLMGTSSSGTSWRKSKAKWTTEIAFCVKINTSHYDWCQPCQAIIRTEKSETRFKSSKGTKRRRGQVPPISRQEIRMQIRKSKGLKLQIEERRSQMKQKETKKKEQAVRNIWLSEVKWRGWKPT